MVAFDVFNPENLHQTTGYAHAIRMGDLLFVSGQISMTEEGEFVGEGDPRAQTEQIFENLRRAVEAGGSSMDRVGKITVFATSIESRSIVGEIRNRIWEPYGFVPAATFAVVSSLATPEILVEIEAVAAITPD
jgi:2-iminobutanoate/2-iminopropanoate deaminase